MSAVEEEIHDAEFEDKPTTREDPGQQEQQPETALVYQPAHLLAIAVEKNFDIDKLEKLMALQERWEAKQALAAFNRAIAKFQALVPEIPKDKKGYSTFYAPLGTIDRVIKDALQECGLSKTWRQIEEPDQVTVICTITHEEGHSKEYPIGPVPWKLLEKTDRMNGLQHRAATLTYLQRYSLIGALGLSTADADTDGRDPNDKGKKETKPQSVSDQLRQKRGTPSQPGAEGQQTDGGRQVEGPRKINKEELLKLGEAAKESGMPNAAGAEIVKKAGFKETTDITVDKLAGILKQVKDWTAAPTEEKEKPKAETKTKRTAPIQAAEPPEAEQARIKVSELVEALTTAGFKTNVFGLIYAECGERKIASIPVASLAQVTARLEMELGALRAKK
jgi:hypothetical protein